MMILSQTTANNSNTDALHLFRLILLSFSYMWTHTFKLPQLWSNIWEVFRNVVISIPFSNINLFQTLTCIYYLLVNARKGHSLPATYRIQYYFPGRTHILFWLVLPDVWPMLLYDIISLDLPTENCDVLDVCGTTQKYYKSLQLAR